MKMAGFGFTETNTQFAYCTSLHIPHFPLLRQQEDFQSYFAFSASQKEKAIWCAVEGGNDGRPNV